MLNRWFFTNRQNFANPDDSIVLLEDVRVMDGSYKIKESMLIDIYALELLNLFLKPGINHMAFRFSINLYIVFSGVGGCALRFYYSGNDIRDGFLFFLLLIFN